MTLRLDCIAFDAHDPIALGRWWAELLRGEHEVDDDGDVVVRVEGATPLAFFAVDDDKAVKNRLHIDLRPDDQEAEVARAEAMGATHVDIGQGDQTWVVLADPEGNEFCILRALPSDGAQPGGTIP